MADGVWFVAIVRDSLEAPFLSLAIYKETFLLISCGFTPGVVSGRPEPGTRLPAEPRYGASFRRHKCHITGYMSTRLSANPIVCIRRTRRAAAGTRLYRPF